MSLSDDRKNRDEAWGTIFAGGREHSLGGIEHARSTAWNEQDEAAYLDRVRRKAEEAAAGLIAGARADAERIREEARQEGYDAGVKEAEADLEAFRGGMSESVAAVLGAIEGQCAHIFAQWREDLIHVTRLAVERISGLEMEERRRESLDALLMEAVSLLEKRRELVIRVNPEDEPVISDIVGMTKERFSDVKSWRVKADADISPGGMVVESESSLAEGRVESRMAAVDEVLKRLSLPDGPSAETLPAQEAAAPHNPASEAAAG